MTAGQRLQHWRTSCWGHTFVVVHILQVHTLISFPSKLLSNQFYPPCSNEHVLLRLPTVIYCIVFCAALLFFKADICVVDALILAATKRDTVKTRPIVPSRRSISPARIALKVAESYAAAWCLTSHPICWFSGSRATSMRVAGRRS